MNRARGLRYCSQFRFMADSKKREDMNKNLILCVEDSIHVQAFNKPLLEAKGFTVRLAMSLHEAREEIIRETPSLIVLDIHLPDGNGLDFLRELRETSSVPVIALTNDNEEKDIVIGLESGCDDYVPKPYTFPVLYARIVALFRRIEQVPEKIVRGRLTLDVTANSAFLDGHDLLLAQKEFALLMVFVQNEERYVSAKYLYEKIWKVPMIENNQAVKSSIKRLRAKIEGCGYMITCTRHEGYCFERE